MATFTAFTTLSGAEAAAALGEALEALSPEPQGGGVFELEDGSGLWEIGGYFSEAPDTSGLALLAAAHGAKDFVISELPDTDWVAQVRRELHPVEAGRFFVYGSHDADKVPEGRIALMIEAAMAFGTGHHGTTQGCLTALDLLAARLPAPHRVADIGCGTGVLAMAAARVFPEAQIIASDIDAVAVEVAQANLAANDLAHRMDVVEAAGFRHPALDGAQFDLILANILKGPLIELAPEMAAHLAPGGRIILSGLLNEQADDVVEAYRAQGIMVENRQQFVDWTCLTLGQ